MRSAAHRCVALLLLAWGLLPSLGSSAGLSVSQPAIFLSDNCATEPNRLLQLCVQGTQASPSYFLAGPAGFYVPAGTGSVTVISSPTPSVVQARAPDANDDTLDGYVPGQVWQNTAATPDEYYIAVTVGEAAANWQLFNPQTIKNNAVAAAPTVNDDETLLYDVGSSWTDTTIAGFPVEYKCTDPTDGAAVWIRTTATIRNAVLLRDPLVTDDSSQGYGLGSQIVSLVNIELPTIWYATSVGVGTAEWVCLSCAVGITPSLQSVGAVGAKYAGANDFEWCPITSPSEECVRIRAAPSGIAIEHTVAGVLSTWQDECYPGQTRAFNLGNNSAGWTVACDTGIVTYANNLSARPAMTTSFDASAFNFISGNACVGSTVAVNSGATRPIAYCTDADTGMMSYEIQELPATYATDSTVHFCLKATSITNQSGATLIFDQQVICISDNEAEPAVPSPADTNRITLIFGNQANDNQGPVCVDITPSGCAAGDRMIIYVNAESDLTATQSAATAFVTGGSVTLYKSSSR